MAYQHLHVFPGYKKNTVLTEDNTVLSVPLDWDFLPAGDAAITRKVKSLGQTWGVQVRRGKRIISKGIWASKEHIHQARQDVEQKRATPEYARKRRQDCARREKQQQEYAGAFYSSVIRFLDFHTDHLVLAKDIAHRVTAHAAPVGSGTVARTQRISIAERAEAAVIAWMRHHTTNYDTMTIHTIKGKRREVRRKLAQRSAAILERYRRGDPVAADCPLQKALHQKVSEWALVTKNEDSPDAK